MLALVGVALADSAVSSVYWKIQYKTKRPVDLIRAGDQEAKLVRDTDWKPLSPEIFYDYPSTLTTYAENFLRPNNANKTTAAAP